jgi:hypothetical protein
MGIKKGRGMSITHPRFGHFSLLATVASVALGASAAWAAPLDEAACTQLKEEHAQLAKGGTKADLDKGPAWAKANLTPERLKEVERYIAVEEQLLFRCPQPKPAREAATGEPLPKHKRARTKTGGTDDDTETGDPATPAPKASAKAAAAKDKEATRTPTPPAKSASSAPKSKTNDAYVPPKKLLPDSSEAQ